jgi:ubiquinol-cytochrome c reductase iron-sulfur subunit
MSGNDTNSGNVGPANGERRPEPRRVIGTPPPARGLLDDLGQPGGGRGRAPGDAGAPELRELPSSPPDLFRAKKYERIVSALFLLSAVAGISFIAAYIGLEVSPLPPNARTLDGMLDAVLRSNLALGTSMAVAFLALAAGFTLWVRHVMPPVELVEERHPPTSSPEDRKAFARTFMEGADASGFLKRPMLRRTLIAAVVPAAVAPIVLLRDLGPLPGTVLRHTVWRKGLRLWLYGSNRPIRPEEFNEIGSMITVIPEGYQDNQDALAKATAIIIKMRPGQLKPPTVMNWTVDNIVCYSKICTHVGCPVALYEQTTHRILCPCHQSTFDATRGAEVIFGPAPRSLPQLPLTTDAEGYLVAKHDFVVPVGPAFWELGSAGFHGGNETS